MAPPDDDAAPDDDPRPPQVLRVELTGQSIWQAIGAILLTIVLLRAAAAARTVLVLVALAFFFSLALDPAVRALHERYGWRRGAAVGVIYATGFTFVLFFVAVLVPALAELAAHIATHGDEWIASLQEWSSETFGLDVQARLGETVASGGERSARFVGNAFGTLAGLATGGVALLFNLATVAMFTFYFTAEAPQIKRAVLRLFAPETQQRIGWTWDQAIVQTGGYFYSRLILMVINAAGFLVTMIVVGMPVGLALPLAVFGGFVSVFIPAVGTYIGAALPILVTIGVRGLVAGAVVLGYALLYQQIENYLLSPRISADTMALNGGVAFGAALAGGAIAGPMGAFVALPVAALISASIGNYARSHEVVYHSGPDGTETVG